MSRLFIPTKYNSNTKEQFWCSAIQEIHDSICGCLRPFAHLFDIIIPEDHADRHKTIQQIVQRDTSTPWPSTGDEEENHGMASDSREITERENGQEEEEDLDPIPEEEIEGLLAAAENLKR